jgi:hypothetical protein
MAARPVITKFIELADAATVDLVATNPKLAASIASGGGGASAFGDLTDAATVDLEAVNGPLGTKLAALSAAIAARATQAALDALAATVSNVDNTSDADKPVSTAQQAALDLKANSADLGTAAARQADQDLRTTDDVTFDGIAGSGNLEVTGTSELSGNVSIGGDPVIAASPLYVRKDFNSASSLDSVAYFWNAASGGNQKNVLNLRGGTQSTDYILAARTRNFDPVLWVGGDQRVGIKTTAPSVALDVTGDIKASGVIQTGVYTVGTVPAAGSYPGGLIGVSDESGGYTLAFSDGTSWRRMADRAVIS